MTLKVIGCFAALPSLLGLTSCYTVHKGGGIYMIDCGEGAQIGLIKNKIKRNNIRCIFISHLHGDHVFGLPGLITSYAHYQRSQKLTIIGPIGIKLLLDTILDLCKAHIFYEIEIIEVNNSAYDTVIYQDENITAKAFPLKHRITCIGYHISEVERPANFDPQKLKEYLLDKDDIQAILSSGRCIKNNAIISAEMVSFRKFTPKTIAYCSDTVYDLELIPYIKDVNLLIHEATYGDALADKAGERMHSTAQQAAMIARAANVGQLLITHFSTRYESFLPLLDEATMTFKNTILATEGLEIEVA